MKIVTSIAFRGALLALLALCFSTLSGHAQTLNADDATPAQGKVKIAKLVAESPELIAREDIYTSDISAQKYLLHVSDRAQRGRVEPTEAGASTVLPELRAASPEPSPNKIAKDARKVRSS